MWTKQQETIWWIRNELKISCRIFENKKIFTSLIDYQRQKDKTFSDRDGKCFQKKENETFQVAFLLIYV